MVCIIQALSNFLYFVAWRPGIKWLLGLNDWHLDQWRVLKPLLPALNIPSHWGFPFNLQKSEKIARPTRSRLFSTSCNCLDSFPWFGPSPMTHLVAISWDQEKLWLLLSFRNLDPPHRFCERTKFSIPPPPWPFYPSNSLIFLIWWSWPPPKESWGFIRNIK